MPNLETDHLKDDTKIQKSSEGISKVNLGWQTEDEETMRHVRVTSCIFLISSLRSKLQYRERVSYS